MIWRSRAAYPRAMNLPRIRRHRWRSVSVKGGWRALVAVTTAACGLGVVVASPAAAAVQPCAAMGSPVYVGKVRVPTCTAFAKGSTAVRLPADSTNIVYGMVHEGFGGVMGARHASAVGLGRTESAQSLHRGQAHVANAPTAAAYLTTRGGKQMLGQASLVPAALRGKPTLMQFLFKATLKNGKLTTLTPILFVPLSTMVKPFIGLQFAGNLANLNATEGIPESAVFRWNFGTSIKNGSLSGTFPSLNSTVLAWVMREPPRDICAEALRSNDAATAWYSPVLGTNGVIRISWNPAMHAPGDSELVVFMDGGASYMTSAPRLHELLRTNINPWQERTFTIHGNPMGTPYAFTGQFMPAAALTPCASFVLG